MGFYTPEKAKSSPGKKTWGRSATSNVIQKKKYTDNLDGDRKDLHLQFMKELRKRRELHDGQEALLKAFIEDGFSKLFFRIGRKGTKTTVLIISAWYYMLQAPNRNCYIVAPTISQAEDIYWDENRIQWCDMPDKDLHDMFVKDISIQKKMITFVNGSYIKLLGTWSGEKGRGGQPSLLMVDETKDCKASYLDGMDPNLAAKADSKVIFAGTPPKKRNHFHEWEDRIRNDPQGICFKYSSYVNTALPHLKHWLDRKREELIAAGKEDEWLREYMAEDCFSSDERVLPDIDLVEHEEFIAALLRARPTSFIPMLGVTLTQEKLSACFCVSYYQKFDGMKIWPLEMYTNAKLWNTSYHEIYAQLEEKMSEWSSHFPKEWRKIIHDETKSFSDVIPGFASSREDQKWDKRGIPLLKEMILGKKISFSTKSDVFAVEAQNLLKEDNLSEFPAVCTMAMLANEYYQAPSAPKNEQAIWDKLAPLRQAGIPTNPPRSKRKTLYRFNWD